MFSYTNILKQSLKISWKNKYLWFFGFFASSVGGFITFNQTYQNPPRDLTQLFSSYFNLASSNIVLFVIYTLIALMILALVIFLIWLSFSSYGALISYGKKHLKNKADKKMSIKNGVQEGNRHFWKILGLDLSFKIIGGVLFLLPSLPLLIYNSYPVLSVICTTIILIISVILITLLFFTVKLGFRISVLEKVGLKESFKQGFVLAYDNFWINIEMGIIFLFINIIMGVLIVILSILFLLTIFAAQFLLTQSWVLAGANIIIIIAIVILTFLIGAGFNTFKNLAWTNLYLEIKDNKAKSKLKRIFKSKK